MAALAGSGQDRMGGDVDLSQEVRLGLSVTVSKW